MANITHEPITIKGKQTTIAQLWEACGHDDNHPDYIQATHELLMQMRSKAETIELKRHHQDPKKKPVVEPFQCAALLRTTDGRFYLTANKHSKRSQADNDCAEANAINEMLNSFQSETDQWEALRFVGGKSLYKQGKRTQEIADNYKGGHVTPCGNCRDMLQDNAATDKPVRIDIHPLLPAESVVMPYDPDLTPDQRPQNMIRTYLNGARLWLPRKAIFENQQKGFKLGLLGLSNPNPGNSFYKGISSSTHITSLENAERSLSKVKDSITKEELTRLIYEQLYKRVHREIHKKTDNGFTIDSLKEHTIDFAIVRTDSGGYYIGQYLESDSKQSMRTSIENAIQNSAGTRNVTDIFLLHLNMEEMMGQIENSNADITLPLPSGKTIDFINKARSRKPSEQTTPSPFEKNCEGSPRIHIFGLGPSYKRDFSTSLMQSYSIPSLLSDRFVGPKEDYISSPHHGPLQMPARYDGPITRSPEIRL